MDILGIGIPELVFILFLAILILGPHDLQKISKTIGTSLRKFVTSDNWRIIQETSREIRNLPNRLMHEANDDFMDFKRDMKKATEIDISPKTPHAKTNTILPKSDNLPPIKTSIASPTGKPRKTKGHKDA